LTRLFLILPLLALAACSDANEARRTLENAGYTDIQTTGYAWTGCGKDDRVHTGFTAKGPTGKRIEGVVCAGFGPFAKGATIRTY
jgi:hypothetical protein